MPDDAPTYDIAAWECPGDLMVDLMQGKLPLPFWLTYDGSAMKITAERVDGFIDGLRVGNLYDLARAEG